MNLNDIFGGQVDLTEVDATDVPTGSGGIFDTGVYPFIVERAELKENNAKNGMLVSAMLRVISETSQNVLWLNFNVQHPKQQTQQIGREQFQKFCKGCGLSATPSDPAELVDCTPTLGLIKKETRASLQARRKNPQVEPEFENTVTNYQAELDDTQAQKPADKPASKLNTNINL